MRLTLLFGTLFFFTYCMGQTKATNIKMIGIPIKKSEFLSKQKAYVEKMRNNNLLDANDYIVLVRLSNTIQKDNLTDTTSKILLKLFFPTFFEKCLDKLSATEWKGGCFYSKQYDIFIGGQPHYNSQYKIQSKKYKKATD